MEKPTSEFQLQFLDYIQRLLDGGGFVATYKYALIIALADLSVEKGDDSSASLPLNAKDVAKKFIRYYSRQVIDFRGADGMTSGVLHQNTGKQAAIINWVREASPKYETKGIRTTGRLLQEDSQLVKKVSTTVANMPLWKLQTIAGSMDSFLYENIETGSEFELRPGIAFCFRKFHGLIVRLAQNGWVRFIRERPKNKALLGQTSDLAHFMFGVNRSSLLPYRAFLTDLQGGKCFYCSKERNVSHVDHFIPWSWYNLDLGHNFVIACKNCNGKKGDMLAAPEHLNSWLDRNELNDSAMCEFFDDKGLPNDKDSSLFVAQWAYGRVAGSNGHTWVRGKEFLRIAVSDGWIFPTR